MNSPLKKADVQIQDAIEDYLDYLCAPLLGIASYAQRRRLRLEAADHLYALTEDFQAEGFAPADAVRLALREYGEPWAVGQNFADTCLESGAALRRWGRFTDAATLRAFGWFGVFTVLSLLLLEASLLDPASAGLMVWVQCLAVLSPLAAGFLTGLSLARTTLGICRALGVLSLASAAIGLLLRPHTEGLLFAAFQLVFWLPAGCLTAAVTAAGCRQMRLHRFRPTPH